MKRTCTIGQHWLLDGKIVEEAGAPKWEAGTQSGKNSFRLSLIGCIYFRGWVQKVPLIGEMRRKCRMWRMNLKKKKEKKKPLTPPKINAETRLWGIHWGSLLRRRGSVSTHLNFKEETRQKVITAIFMEAKIYAADYRCQEEANSRTLLCGRRPPEGCEQVINGFWRI